MDGLRDGCPTKIPEWGTENETSPVHDQDSSSRESIGRGVDGTGLILFCSTVLLAPADSEFADSMLQGEAGGRKMQL